MAFADSVISTIQLGGNPASTGTQDEMVFNLDNATAYVLNPALNFGWGGVSAIDTQNNTVAENITIVDIPKSLFGSAVALAINHENDNLYVSSLVALVDFNAGKLVDERCDNRFSSTPCVVSVIDTQYNTVSQNIPVGEGALRIAFNHDNGNMYVTNVVDNTISVIAAGSNTRVK